MPKTPEDQSVMLAVVVGTTDPANRRARTPGVHGATRSALVSAMLSDAGGVAVDEDSTAVGWRFRGHASALGAAIALLAWVQRLPDDLADTELRIGLEVAPRPESESRTAARAAAVAAQAERGEIWLGGDLADLIGDRPPDRFVVRAVKDHVPGSGVHRLVAAREVVPNNLEQPATTFIGRESDVSAILELVDRNRLVTLTGPPGIGKSRLALEVCARSLGRNDGGAWFVPLAPLADPQLVWPATSAAIGAMPVTGVSPVAAVAAAVGQQRVLLVLDNLEHLLPAAGDIPHLLSMAPALHVIATSQTVLGLSDEVEYNVEPMEIGLPRSGRSNRSPSGALALFADRATTASPTFRLDSSNVEQAANICRHLDGLPLAIELAAARLKVLSLAAISERLDNRLAMLSGGPTDRPLRHQSLRGAIGWSYDLLDPQTQLFFRRVSVFRGGWTVDGAAAVSESATADGALDRIVTMLDASLVRGDRAEPVGPRFTMLESLREFGAERLEEAGEANLVRDLHARFVLALVGRLGPSLTGPGQGAALDQLAIEHDNIRAALDHFLTQDPLAALRLASGIWRFWQMRGHLDEGAGWMSRALEGATGAPDSDLAAAHAAAGGMAYWRGDLIETEQHYTAAVGLRRAGADELGIADALFDLAFVFDPSLRPPPEDPDRTAAGIRIAEEAHERYVRAGHDPGIAKSEWLLGSILAGHDLDRAKDILRSSVERFRHVGDPFGLGWSLHSYGLTLVQTGESAAAGLAFAEALQLFAAVSDSSATALLLDDFAEVAKADGDALRMARLKGASAAFRHETQAELAVTNAPWLFEEGVPRGLIDEAAVQHAWRAGQAMSQMEAIAFALRTEAAAPGKDGLRIQALGPLIVERAGRRVSDWSGPKAGNRHALAIFAFLLDRGKRGVTKDECIEVIWPDTDVHQADLNFHRTLSGLRSTLAAAGPVATVILSNGRYRLADGVVDWLDETEFGARLLHAAEATDDLSAIRNLEAARSLYRGDYLDDCPIYGDSDYVEEHRRHLRGRFVDVLVDLGQRYEARRDNSLASTRFREAVDAAGGDCPSAMDGLHRLGVAQA